MCSEPFGWSSARRTRPVYDCQQTAPDAQARGLRHAMFRTSILLATLLLAACTDSKTTLGTRLPLHVLSEHLAHAVPDRWRACEGHISGPSTDQRALNRLALLTVRRVPLCLIGSKRSLLCDSQRLATPDQFRV